jgi:hypothetical protein
MKRQELALTPAAARELGFSGLTQVVVNLAWE